MTAVNLTVWCPKSLLTIYTGLFIESSPFYRAVRIYSENDHTLYSPLKVSQNAF